MGDLLALLTSDATLYSDGAGRVAAIGRSIQGAEWISRFFVGIRKRFPADTRYRFARINGGTGVLIVSGGSVYNAISFELDGHRVRGIYIVRNPEKLRHLSGGPRNGMTASARSSARRAPLDRLSIYREKIATTSPSSCPI